MSISTVNVTIQMRKGLEKDFNASKLSPGEWAVSTDTKYVRMCFAPGVVVRMATYEGFEADMAQVQEILAECQDIQTAVDAMADLAEQHKNAAAASAKLSESWAKGGTNSRPGENTNNSKYFSDLAAVLTAEAEKLLDQAQKVIVAATQGALIPGGTVTFQNLPSNPATGYMYNISNDFTTDNRFVEGAGVFYRAGANVYWTADGKWDVLVGTQVTGVKGAKESTFHVGNVSLSAENIGAATREDFDDRFAINTKTFNALTDFPSSGSGFGVCTATNGITLYDGFTIPKYSRIIFANYGASADGALIAFAANGKTYTAIRNSGTWQNGEIFEIGLIHKHFPTGSTSSDIYEYADQVVAKSKFEIIYITTTKLSDAIFPSYSWGFIMHQHDVICITMWSYLGRTMYIDTRSLNGSWKGVNILGTAPINNLTTATPGAGSLDAYQGNVLDDKIKKSKTLTDFINIPSGADLKSDTYLVPGNYCCIANHIATTLINCPLKSAFTLDVSYGAGDSHYIKQTFTRFNGNGIVIRTLSRSTNQWQDEAKYLPSNVSNYTVPAPPTGTVFTSFRSWSCYIERMGKMRLLYMDIDANMEASPSDVLLFTIPDDYDKPSKSQLINYISSNGSPMTFIMDTSGNIKLNNRNKAVPSWPCRQVITYLAN